MKKLVLCAVAAVFGASAYAAEFYWVSTNADGAPFGDPANWAVGRSADAGNPGNLVPGADDYIYQFQGGATYGRSYVFNFAATASHPSNTWTIRGFTGFDSVYNPNKIFVINGNFTVTETFSNTWLKVEVRNGSKFTIGPDAHSRISRGGAVSEYLVKSGGAAEFGGTYHLKNIKIENQAGGTFTIDPVAFYYDYYAREGNGTYPRTLDNAGTFNFPHGLDLRAPASCYQDYTSDPPVFQIRQNAGTMTFGGDFTCSAAPGKMTFTLNGGTLVANESLSFNGITALAMPADKTATIEVAADKTVNWTNASFAAGTALTKAGGGTLVLGETTPATLNVTAGIIRTARATRFNTLAMSAGTTLELASAGTVLNSLPGYASISFAVDATGLIAGTKLLTSTDAALLAAIQANATVTAGYTLSITGNSLMLMLPPADNDIFSAAGEKNLADVSGWSRGSVPAAGADIYIAGQDTVAVLGGTNVVYNSITVIDGATLKVTGAFTLPPINLCYDSRILFASGTDVELTVGVIATYAEPATLPVMEVASGAKVRPASNFEFKNVHLKNYGTIQCATPTYFGTAEVGETAYFALTAVSGTFDFLGTGFNCWVHPKAAGGRVKVAGKVSFKDSTITSSTTDGYWFKYQVGRANPTDEIIDFELDNTVFDIRDNGSSYFGGAVRVKCFNGGKVEKHRSITSPGIFGRPNFIDQVKLDFDGADTRFMYYFNRNSVTFGAAIDGYEQMTFRNGAYIHIMNFAGNGRSVLGFDDGYWNLTEKPGYDTNYWNGVDGGVPESRTQEYLVKPFTGLKAIRIGDGKSLGLRSYSVNPGTKKEREWNRILEIANVPVTGVNGTLFLTNATPGYSCTAIMTCTNNTATGELLAYPSADGCHLLLADGVNWAGTLVASETIGFTNLTSAALPARVSVGNVRFTGKLPIRVWKGAATTNDMLDIAGTLTAGAAKVTGFEPVLMSGDDFALGDSFVLGTCPAAALTEGWERAFTTSKWSLKADESGGDVVTLKLVYAPSGSVIYIR
jgi:hypothetical protein